LYALTLSHINRFLKLFYCQNQEKICNNTITKDPTTPQVCRYTTLWNVSEILGKVKAYKNGASFFGHSGVLVHSVLMVEWISGVMAAGRDAIASPILAYQKKFTWQKIFVQKYKIWR